METSPQGGNGIEIRIINFFYFTLTIIVLVTTRLKILPGGAIVLLAGSYNVYYL
jgi:hypothetical protein